MQAHLASPFDNLHWNPQDLANAVPVRLHQIDLFDAAYRDATAPANAARFAFVRCPRAPYTAALALPTTFQIR